MLKKNNCYFNIILQIWLPTLFALAAYASPSPNVETNTQTRKKSDYRLLIDTLLPFAKQMLQKHSEFYPFGADVDTKGKINLDAADTGEGEHPNSTALAKLLLQALTKKPDASSFAICLDTRFSLSGAEKTDAIKLMLRSKQRKNRDVIIPYKKDGVGKFSYSEPIYFEPDDPNSLQCTSHRVVGLE